MTPIFGLDKGYLTLIAELFKPPVDLSKKLTLVDVGSAGGLQNKWSPHLDRIFPVLFEPNPVEAERLRGLLGGDNNAQVVEAGLFNTSGPQDLNITKHWGCTSIRRPNKEVLSKYQFTDIFDVIEVTSINCDRYDTLYQAGKVPIPEAIKIDVQGCEYEVLEGFGDLLNTCIGIELEAHFYPIYENQRLLHDLVDLTASFGLRLRRLDRVPHFDGDLVEVDAYFTRERASVMRYSQNQIEKFLLLQQVWELPAYF